MNNQRKVVDTKTPTKQQGLLDDNSTVEPPEPIPNSEVKRSRADGSVGFPHVRVGHRQALILKIPSRLFCWGFFLPVRKFWSVINQYYRWNSDK